MCSIQRSRTNLLGKHSRISEHVMAYLGSTRHLLAVYLLAFQLSDYLSESHTFDQKALRFTRKMLSICYLSKSLDTCLSLNSTSSLKVQDATQGGIFYRSRSQINIRVQRPVPKQLPFFWGLFSDFACFC